MQHHYHNTYHSVQSLFMAARGIPLKTANLSKREEKEEKSGSE